jgi:hypothetical protein
MNICPKAPSGSFGAVHSLLLLLAVAGLSIAAAAQGVNSLSQARTLYIAPFTGGAEAARIQQSFVRHLEKSRFQLVQSPQNADAIVKGDGQVWVRGYVAINPRTPTTDRQAVYGGYLSVEVAGADGQPLWSWLATPSKTVWSNVLDDLAGNAAKKLIEASASASLPPASSSPANALRQTTLNAGGATFPAPLYQKWFEDFEQFHPGVHVRYAQIGSQLGDEKLLAGELDFAGSDVAPEVAVSDPRASALRRFATVLGAVVPIYNI